MSSNQRSAVVFFETTERLTDWLIDQVNGSLPEYGVWQQQKEEGHLCYWLQQNIFALYISLGISFGKDSNYPLADNFTQSYYVHISLR